MDVKLPLATLAALVSMALLVTLAEGSGMGISIPGDASINSTTSDTLFFPYRPGIFGLRYFRDLEFQLSSRYSIGRGDATPGRSGTDNTTLDRFGATLTDSIGKNPFGAPYADFQLVHDYFSRTNQQYVTNPLNPTGFTLPISDAIYLTPDKSHVDSYIIEPGQELMLAEPSSGKVPSGFTTPKEDSSTGHWSSPTNYTVLNRNSNMITGPSRTALADAGGTGWTRPGQSANWIFMHEFQHLLTTGSTTSGSVMDELFSAAAEVLSGDLPNEAAVFDYSYTWSLLSLNASGNLGGVRRSGANYAGRRLLAAYLLYNYRNQDTTATLNAGLSVGGFADDLFYRWVRKPSQNLGNLQTLLSNASCYACSLRTSFNPGGVPLPDYDRLQLLIHQMRVASFVNNPFLAADASGYGPYGYPPRFGFSPASDVGAWLDNDPYGPNVVAFPQEVTARPSWVSRDTVISKDRSRDGVSYPLVLQPYGSEYWVIRSTSGIPSGTDLMVRVESDSIFRTSSNSNYCFPIGKIDGRLLATLVGYTQQSDSLWNHPEDAGTVLDTRWVDVDSLSGEFVFTLPNFGTQYRAALLVLSLGDGPAAYYNGWSQVDSYLEAVRYRLNLGLRTAPHPASDPAPLVESSVTEDYPAWSPDGTEIAYESADSPLRILRKSVSGGAATVLVSASNDQHTPDWSPRGDRIAFAQDASGGTRHIRLYDLTTQVATDLTSGTVSDLYPVFQPNGQRLAYVRTVPNSGQWTIRRVQIDGSNDTAILTTALSAPIVSPRWTPDGGSIYFVSNGRTYSVSASGGAAVPQDGLDRGIAGLDFPQGNGRLLIENGDSLRWACTNLAFMPYRRIALRDTLATPKDTEMRWYRTGASYFHPRYSFDNTRVAYRSDQNSVGGGDLFLGQAVYDHAPNMSAVVDTVVGEGIGFSIALPTTDSDGDALTYSGAYMPAGSNFLANLFSWANPTTAGSPFYMVLRAVSPGGAVGSKVVKITVLPRPEPPNDLIADAGRHTAAAAWTEPTQPSGQADSTQVRYTVNTPITEQNFATAAKLGTTVTAGPAETMHCVEDSGMVSCRSYYFAAKTWRNGIPSTISNIATASTTCSGTLNVSCGDLGLWGGGGGGGSMRTGGTSMASVGLLSSASQSPKENSLLGGIPGEKRADLMKIPTAIEPVNDQLLVLLRKSDGEEFALGQVSLFAVDHASGEQALSSNNGVLLGTTTPVEVTDGPADALAIESGGTFGSNGLLLERNEVVTLDLGGSPTPQALVIEASLFGAPVVRDSAGIAVQVPDGADGWRTLDLIHPRRLTDRQAVELAGAQRARIVALGRYTVRGIQGLLVSGRPSLTPLILAGATHSSTGDVKGDISGSDSRATTIRVGDSVELAFTAPPAVPGMVRDLFLFASGVGTSAPATVPGSAAVLVSAAPSFVNALGAARPNPTSGRVTISYTLAARSDSRMSIYNVAGRLVRTLVNETQESGPHEVTWDGRTDSGAASNAGVYFYRLEVGTWTSQQKFVVLER